MKKSTEIKDLSAAELVERIDATRQELGKMKINHAVSPLENPTTMRKTRKEITRMLTVLTQKQK